jgi:hypothetical protein
MCWENICGTGNQQICGQRIASNRDDGIKSAIFVRLLKMCWENICGTGMEEKDV